MIPHRANICTVGLIVVVFGFVILDYQSRFANLRADKAALLRRQEQAERLAEENRRLAQASLDTNELKQLQGRHRELLRLRGQVGLLGQAINGIARNSETMDGKPNSPALRMWEEGRIKQSKDLDDTLQRDALKEAGNKTPSSVLETVLWAITSGHSDLLVALRSEISGSPLADPEILRARLSQIAGAFEGVTTVRSIRSIEYGNGRVNILFRLDRKAGHLEGQPLTGGIWIRPEKDGWRVENIYFMNEAL
jgi:hypothetical protein